MSNTQLPSRIIQQTSGILVEAPKSLFRRAIAATILAPCAMFLFAASVDADPPAPIISTPTGTFNGPTQVTIASEPGALTFITTDGSAPSGSSQPYWGCPIMINYSQTLRAISTKGGSSSLISSATYTLDANIWPAPSPSDTTAPAITLELPTPTQ